MSSASAASPAGSAELTRPPALAVPAPLRLLAGAHAMARAELQKLRHDCLDLITRSVQPLLWLFVFGTALRHNHQLSAGASA
jgi:ABC-2 type transport system permease protein